MCTVLEPWAATANTFRAAYIASCTFVGISPFTATFDAREGLSLRLFNGSIWLLGGANASHVAIADAWVTTEGNVWTRLAVPWPQRTDHASVALPVGHDDSALSLARCVYVKFVVCMRVCTRMRLTWPVVTVCVRVWCRPRCASLEVSTALDPPPNSILTIRGA